MWLYMYYNIRYCIRQISSHVMWNVMMQRLENTNDHGTSHSSHLTTLLEALLIMLCFPEPIRPSPSQELNLACKFTVDQVACVLQWPKLWIMAYEQMILEQYRSATALVLSFPRSPLPRSLQFWSTTCCCWRLHRVLLCHRRASDFC